MFAPSPTEGAFHQGEILSDVIQVRVRVASMGQFLDALELEEEEHPFAVVLTQECDLDWDHKARLSEMDANQRLLKQLPNVLLCELFPETTIRPRIKGSDIWKRITSNQDERYHRIPSVPANADCVAQGLPMLIADFKRVFTIPTDELYHRLSLGLRRRVTLRIPFVQDLSNRYASYCLRVALPEPDEISKALAPPPGDIIAPPASPLTTGHATWFRRLSQKLRFSQR